MPFFRYLILFTPLIHLLILVFLILAAIEDYKTREVSNGITVPLFFGGVAVIVLSPEPLYILISLLLYLFWYKRWMGGADVKVLIALLGLWSEAALVAFFLLGLWGMVLLIRKQKESFPGVVVMAVGAGLTFAGELSIMFLN